MSLYNSTVKIEIFLQLNIQTNKLINFEHYLYFIKISKINNNNLRILCYFMVNM